MVKTRLEGEITFDENGYKRRAACVCFRDEREDQILLITSKNYTIENNWWIIPGGSIEALEDPHSAAEREVCEEGGVRGKIIRSLGQVVNEKTKSKTWVYVMIVENLLDQWEDNTMHGRQRKWFSIDRAKELLAACKPVQRKYLDLAKPSKETVSGSHTLNHNEWTDAHNDQWSDAHNDQSHATSRR